MFTHYLKIALRNLLKNKVQSAISIIGLTVGFVCITLSAIWIRYETTYDTSHSNADNIYSIFRTYEKNKAMYSVLFGYEVENILKKNPEVGKAANIAMASHVSLLNNSGKMISTYGSETALFDIFSISFLYGNKEAALSQPYSVVLNENTAKELFGSAEQAIGKTLNSISSDEENNQPYTVTGITKDIKHTNLKLTALIPFTQQQLDEWEWNNMFLGFIILKDNINKADFFQKLGVPDEKGIAFKAVPFPQIQYKYEYHGVNRLFNYNYIVILVVVSFLLFICAIFNHISIFTSFTYTRLKALGLHKSIGANTKQLFILLITEFLFSILLAFILAICIIEIVRPMLENVTKIMTDVPQIIAIIVGVIVLGVLLSVLLIAYPLWKICSKDVNKNMTGKRPMGQQRVQKILICIQLVISIFFLFITSIMYYQTNYMNNKDLGINIKNVIKVTPNNSHLKAFRNKAGIIVSDLPKDPSIVTAFKQGRDFFLENGNKYFSTEHLDWQGKNPNDPNYAGSWIEVQSDFFDFFDVSLKQGRLFSKDYTTDEQKCIINEKFAEIIGEPIGKSIKWRDNSYEIIGVVEDIQDRSLKNELRPTIFELSNWVTYTYVRHAEGKATEALKQIEKVMKEQDIDNYSTQFMEDSFRSFTKSDTAMRQIISIVSLACLVISAFGVYSLTLYSMRQRKRELAIRKVMGASVSDIINMFFKEYVWLVVIASIIAIPPAYYIMDKWLQTYANRIGIEWWLIIGIIIIITIIVISTVLRQIVKAANSNPAEVIKSE